MAIVDIIIVGVIGISSILGLLKGFLREFVSLVSLITALVVAFYFADVPVQWIPDETVSIMGEALKLRELGLLASFIVTALVVLLIGRMLSLAISGLVGEGGVKRFDQFIGFLFGILRGGIIVVLLVMIAGLTRLPSSDTWKDSGLINPFADIARIIIERLPEEYSQHFIIDAVSDAVSDVVEKSEQ